MSKKSLRFVHFFSSLASPKKKSVKKGIQCVGGIGMEELEKVIEFQDKVIIEYQGKVEEVEGKDVGLYEYKK